MPLTPNDVLRISENVEKMYSDCTSQLIINVSRHFATDKALETREWETKKLSELGALTNESIEIIAANTGKAPETIRAAITEGMGLEIKDAERTLAGAAAKGVIQSPSVSWEASEGVRSVVKNLSDQAIDDANIVNTVMLQSTRARYVSAVQYAVTEEQKLIEELQTAANLKALDEKLDITQKALNASTMSVATGAEARTTALRRTIKQLADQGITGYVDAGGHHWTPEAYINMDIRTTVHNAAIQGQKARAEDYGVSTFQISSHAGARPLCAPYQGKFYSWDGSSGVVEDLYGRKYPYESIYNTSYGEPAGIFGINCGHRPNTFVSGYNVPRFEPTEDDAENARQYELSQKQRYYEREIRKDKTEALAYDAAGNKEAFNKKAVQIKEKNAQYKAFCDENGLTARNDRLQVGGYNKDMSAKVSAAARAASANAKQPKDLSNSEILTRLKASGIQDNPVKKLEKKLTTQEIVERLGGADQTRGSCSSLAFAYAGNVNGYDVIDYRGGDSQMFFARNGNIKTIAQIDGVKSTVVSNKNDFTAANTLLDGMKENKEYYLATGRHAAIVKKTKDEGLQYLELQNIPERNGFHPLNNGVLKSRFGCQKSHTVAGFKYESTSVLIEVDSLKGDEVKSFLGYINNTGIQKKGAGGGVK